MPKIERMPKNPLDRLIRKTDNESNEDKASNMTVQSEVDTPSVQDKATVQSEAGIQGLRSNQDKGSVQSVEGRADAVGNEGNESNEDMESEFIVKSFKIRRRWDEVLDRIAYYEHEWKQDVMDRILEGALKDVEYEPIPAGKKGK